MGPQPSHPLTKPQHETRRQKNRSPKRHRKPHETQNPELAALLSPPSLTGSSGRARLGGLGHSG